MADVYSTGYTAVNATPQQNLEPKHGGGRIRYYYDTYLQGAAAGNIGDVIHMKKLPKGARIVPGGMLYWGTGTTSETLAVGVTGSAASILIATAAATAGSAAIVLPFASGATMDIAAEIEVIITNAVAAIAAAQRITLHLPYVID